MFAVEGNRFALVIPSVAAGTQPTPTYGTAVTPGNLAYGAYAQLLAGGSVTDDVCEIEIGINSVGITGTARDCVVTIGWDPAGGTNYGVAARTSIDHLLGSCASSYMGGTSGLGGGVVYKFPLGIPAGSSFAAKAMVNTATVTAINVYIKLRCRPTAPELLYVGGFVDTYGIPTSSGVPTTAGGTAIAPGTAADGAYVSLGALSTIYGYFELGLGCNDLTMSNEGLQVDVALGDGSNKDIVIHNAPFTISNIETITKQAGVGRHATAGPASTIFVRAQASLTPDSNVSAAVYAVGG